MAQLTEFQSKTILARFGLPVQKGVLATTAAEASAAAEMLGPPVVIKAMVPVGGRGKAGAIRRADSQEEAALAFQAVTAVDFGDLRAVEALVEPWQQCVAEYYLAVVIDAELAAPVVLFTPAGGVDVESGAAITRIPLREDGSVPAVRLRRAAYQAGVPPPVAEKILGLAQGFARAGAALDASLVEVNPVGLREDGSLVALDARLVVDDHALHRQPELRDLVVGTRPRPLEDRVRDATRLEYVRLDGWLGLISGGAGMTMTAMDVTADLGAAPACFLDCSANPTAEGYGAALDLLQEDPQVRAILVSIFGGLTHMDRVARTLVRLLPERNITKPITLRLMGTNVDAAEETLTAAGLVNYRSLEEAVAAAIASVEAPTDPVEVAR